MKLDEYLTEDTLVEMEQDNRKIVQSWKRYASFAL